MHLDYYN